MDSKLSTLLSGLTHTKQQLEEARYLVNTVRIADGACPVSAYGRAINSPSPCYCKDHRLICCCRSELREKEEQLEKTMKENEAIKEAATSDPGCSGCGQLRRELEDALHMLNDTSSAKYGDLLRENFALTRKVP